VQTELEVYINDQRIGDFKVSFIGDQLHSINDRGFKLILKRLLKKESYLPLKGIKLPYLIEEFPYPIRYNDSNLRITIQLNYDQLQPDFYKIETDPSIKYEGYALEPAPLSGSVGIISEKGFADSYFGGDYFSTSYSSFVNLNGYLLESQGFYESRKGEKDWFRGNTRLNKDFVDEQVRVQLGDTASRNLGFMSARNIGGLSIGREFSINPYQRPFPQGEREFTLLSRSRVRTYVNGTLIKDEFLPAGNYQLSRLPLIDGLNFVRVEMENALGETSILNFDIPTSTQVLKEGIFDFQVALGRSYEDVDRKRKYNGNNIFSFSSQYGFTDQYTGSLYTFVEDEFAMGGLIHGLSSRWGNIFYETSYSKLKSDQTGMANALTWQYQNSNYQGSYRLTTRVRLEDFTNSYSREYTDSLKALDYSYQLNISYPILNFMSLSAGVGESYYEDSIWGKKRFYNLSSNIRIKNNLNISVFATHSSETNQVDNNALSFFLTWNFAESNHYVNVYRDIENDTSRLSVTKDNNNKMYSPRYNVNIEDSTADTRVNSRINLPTPMADFALKGSVANRDEASNNETKNPFQGVITVGTSLLFAANEDGMAFGISRANAGSFALFKPSKDIEDQLISIRSTSPYADTQTPAVGSLAIPNLVDYQYREIQIDPTLLTEGVSLQKEKLIVHSGYKTGHLISVLSNGLVGLKGRLLFKGKPLAYKVIKASDVVAFTDDQGYFYFPGIAQDFSTIYIKDFGKLNYEFTVDKDKRGIKDIGTLNVSKDR